MYFERVFFKLSTNGWKNTIFPYIMCSHAVTSRFLFIRTKKPKAGGKKKPKTKSTKTLVGRAVHRLLAMSFAIVYVFQVYNYVQID